MMIIALKKSLRAAENSERYKNNNTEKFHLLIHINHGNY